MDQRCLYGHRVPADFTFAIERKICPTCGAGTVTVDGYQLARRLSTEVPLAAVDAFNTVAYLERNYVLSARGDATTKAPPANEEVGEVLDVDSAEQALEASDAALDAPEPARIARTAPRVRAAGTREEIPDHPVLRGGEELDAIEAGDAGEDIDGEEMAFFNI